MATVGNYQIHELIGEGGFGRVFKGYHVVLKRDVAIKVCTVPQHDFRQRFLREAEIAAGLRHPNIVTVYDIGEVEGEPYLVQEYLSGEDLDVVIRRRDPVPLARRVSQLAQIADALAYAHYRGVVHRDIKPSNIRVLPDGNIRILDFGIAKLVDDDLHLTRTGYSVGTAGYLAPEQLRGDRIDHRADMFSFGILAYELLTYQKPFSGDSISAVYYQIAHESPPPIEPILPDCPSQLVAVVMRCLQKAPDERFAGCAEIVAELTAILQQIGEPSASSGIPMEAERVSGVSNADAAGVPPTRRDRAWVRRWHGGRARWFSVGAAALIAIAIAARPWARINAKSPPPQIHESPPPVLNAAPDSSAQVDTGVVVPFSREATHGVPVEANKHVEATRRPAAEVELDARLIVVEIGRDSSEIVARGSAVQRTVELGLIDLLRASGLSVASSADAPVTPTREATPPRVIIAAGRAARAGLALSGTVSVVEQPGALEMKSVRCTLQLRVFDVKTGAVVAEALEAAPGPGGSIESAADRAVHGCLTRAGSKIVSLLDARR